MNQKKLCQIPYGGTVILFILFKTFRVSISYGRHNKRNPVDVERYELEKLDNFTYLELSEDNVNSDVIKSRLAKGSSAFRKQETIVLQDLKP